MARCIPVTTDTPPARRYHHGDLRAALLEATAEEVAEVGLAAASLRKISARAGVSHTAAAHHFGDKRGLLTALATEGHLALAELLGRAEGDLLGLGRAYVEFASTRRAHFEVMFHPDVLDMADPALVAARAESFAPLQVGLQGQDPDAGGTAAYAAWAFVHGVCTLALSGNLPEPFATPQAAFAALAPGTRFS